MAKTMRGRDAIFASLAECWVEIDGRMINFMQAINLEVNLEKTKVEVSILGKTGKGNKAAGWKGTLSATFHYNTTLFRWLLQRYKDTGEDVYFNIYIDNYDPTSDAGHQRMLIRDVNLDGGMLSKFDASADGILEESMDGTYEDFVILEGFKELDGMSI